MESDNDNSVLGKQLKVINYRLPVIVSTYLSNARKFSSSASKEELGNHRYWGRYHLREFLARLFDKEFPLATSGDYTLLHDILNSRSGLQSLMKTECINPPYSVDEWYIMASLICAESPDLVHGTVMDIYTPLLPMASTICGIHEDVLGVKS
ncbi:hypothetical protein Hypma_013862 [Hypsizygus marmoreus]|uniref:Uncharacterized protein n=1 Tax=Hypsizygus marmoreus TaxID=39966 RepID=A0A369K770_HYPMA|nr:hypothetical protein Hypma_013862 [Hypsizygus marmoreus]